jgi:hypothetical protein
LFRKRVPEVANGIVEIVALACVPGRTLLAVRSHASRINPVRACAGAQESLLKTLAAESGGEFFPVTTWCDSPEEFIRGSFSPPVARVVIDLITRRAIVSVRGPLRKIAPRCGLPATTEIMTKLHEGEAALVAKITGWKIQLIIRETGEEPGSDHFEKR